MNDKIKMDEMLKITENMSSKEEYAVKLARYINNNNSARLERKYLNRIKENFNFKIKSFNEIFDVSTGAIAFDDHEVILLKNKNKNHLLFSLFEVNIFENKLKYAYNKRDRIILRGPNNYYFNMAYMEKYTKEEVRKSSEMIKSFLNSSYKEVKNQTLDIYNEKADLKCTLAILDIIRNLLTIILYYFAKIEEDDSIIIFYSGLDNKSIIYKTYKLLLDVYKAIYDVLFIKNQMNIKESLISLITNTIELECIIQKNKNIKLNLKTVRMWRETDYIIENIISIREALIEIKKENKTVIKDEVNVFGVNYGSIDLAILTKVVAEKLKYNNINCGILLINSSYDDLYNKKCINLKCKVIPKTESTTKKNIVIDDNIVSGKSFETAVKIISKNIRIPIAGIIIRPPQINRINQMFTKRNNSRVRIELFDAYIKGLKGKSFFSKLCDDKKNESFLDRLNVFDEIKQSVRTELYKNGLYYEESYVGKLKDDLFNSP